MEPNGCEALLQRRNSGTLTWRGPALMLFARAFFAVVAQAISAAVFALRGSRTPWLDSQPWLPVYAIIIDGGCMALLWRLTRSEGIHLFDLIGFDSARLGRDVLIGLALIPACLAFILGGVYAVGWIEYGTPTPPYAFGALPLPAALYGVLVFPCLWGLTEQMTYNGYLAPRFQAVFRNTAPAVTAVALIWAFQHAVMPFIADTKYIVFRLFSPLPFSLFAVIVYLRMRRLLPLIVAHALMDGASVFIGTLLPLLRA